MANPTDAMISGHRKPALPPVVAKTVAMLLVVLLVASTPRPSDCFSTVTPPNAAMGRTARHYSRVGGGRYHRGSTSSSSLAFRSTSPFRRGGGEFSTTSRGTTGTTTSLHMMFERMSEQLISALVTSQTESARLNLPTVDAECMLLGILDHPQNARKTLSRYKITYRGARRAVDAMYAESRSEGGDSSERGGDGGGWGKMLNLNKKAREVDLPFSTPLKRSLTDAVRVADQLGSELIHSEHVLLALLDYDGGKSTSGSSSSSKRESNSEVEGDEGTTHVNGVTYAEGAHAVFLRMDSIDASSFSKTEFCRSLVLDLSDPNNQGSELVLGGGGGSKAASTPTLSEVGVDLTEAARNEELDPVFGRDDEVYMCLRTLLRRRKNNPCLIGDPGVGKTAIVEGIAQILAAPKMIQEFHHISDRNEDDEIVNREKLDRLNRLAKLCPPKMRHHRLVSVELGNLVAGTKYRGEFEERIQSLMEELGDPNAPPTIVFMDEIHTLIGAGSAEGGIDAANILKPALARGKIQLIGATTVAEYRKCIEKDLALERRLQPIMIREPTIDDSVEILRGIQSTYESHHGVTYAPGAVEAMVKMSDRYVTDRFLPDKAIDLLDECGAMAHMEDVHGSFDGIANGGGDGDGKKPIVTEHTVANVVSEWTDIPTGKLETEETEQLVRLEELLQEQVRGQYPAVHAVSRAVRRARSGLRDTDRPIASFLFCGPTGVGKTELCKQLAEVYYRSKKDMIRIDMSEYMEKHSVSRLTGPPPGYIGYEEGGQLTEAVRRAPHSVVLLDELEKAHGDVLNILLQVMEDGMLTDGKGRTVSFKNVILVMTSNVGSRRILEVATKRGGGGNDSAIGSEAGSISGSIPAPVATPSSPSSSPTTRNGTIDPVDPTRVLAKLQGSPEAMSLMMEAMSDAELRGAMQTAMGGSPADLLRVGRENPRVADFLERIWRVLDMGDVVGSGGAPSGDGKDVPRKEAPKNGLNESGEAGQSFASGLLKQFQDLVPNGGSSPPPSSASSSHTVNDDDVVEAAAVSSSSSSSALSSVTDDEEEIQAAADYAEMTEVVKEELETELKPELLNRIDEIVVFSPLSGDDLRGISELILNETIDRARRERDIHLTVLPDVVDVVMREGSANANRFGARPMRRAVQRYFEDTVSDVIIRGFLRSGDHATVQLGKEDGSFVKVTRERDGESMVSKVEDGQGGIGAATNGRSRRVNGSSESADSALQTDPSLG